MLVPADFPISAGCHAGEFPKHRDEVGLASVAEGVADLREGQPIPCQEFFRPDDPPLKHVAVGWQADALPEEGGEVVWAQPDEFSELAQTCVLSQMRLDVVEHATKPSRRQAACGIVQFDRRRRIVAEQVADEGGRERLAIERLKAKLQGIQGPWILLSNVNHSTAATRFSDEIDQIIIGPSGVFVVEVKHWDSSFLKQRPEAVDAEAEKAHEKAKRVAGKLKAAFDPGFVMASFLLTRGGTGMQAGQRLKVRGVPVFGLGEWKELVNAGGAGVLSADQIDRAARLLVPAVKLALSGDLRNFAGLVNLERQSIPAEAFHRDRKSVV